MKFNRSFSLKEIATLTHSDIISEGSNNILGINEIHMVEQGDITFVDHPKYYQKAINSNATTILINDKEINCPTGKNILYNEDPFAAYITIVRLFRSFEPTNNQISSTATIGKNSFIQPGAFIGNHVTIGENCIIHSNVSIYDHCVVGNNVIIHSNSVIGADAYYFQRKPNGYRKMESCGNVIIGDNVEIGALCAIDRGVSGNTIISDGTKLDNHVQVGHDTYIGKHCLIGSQSAIAGVTRIEDDVIIWGKVAINKDLVIAQGCVILATSAVDKSTEPGKVYFGQPAIEAQKIWRQMASARQLPEVIKTLRNKGIL